MSELALIEQLVYRSFHTSMIDFDVNINMFLGTKRVGAELSKTETTGLPPLLTGRAKLGLELGKGIWFGVVVKVRHY